MTGKGGQPTPVRGPKDAQRNPKKPILMPRAITVNPLVAGAFVIVAAGGVLYGLSAHFMSPAESSQSMVDPVPGSRVAGTSSRMTVGLEDVGEGSMTASLTDDAPVPLAQPVSGPETAALLARIDDLQNALAEAGKDAPDVASLANQIVEVKSENAELKVALRDSGRERDRDRQDFERRLRGELAEQSSTHADAMEQLGSEHDAAIAALEGRLTQLLDERAAASQVARIRSPSVLVNKGAPKGGSAFGAPVVPADPSTSLGRGATFTVALLDPIDAVSSGSITAMVVSDVRSASGKRVLIPSGSTLRGRYRSNTGDGDGRIVISWSDMTILPDGVTKRLNAGPREENAFVTTLWPSDPASMDEDAEVTVLVAYEISLIN